MPTDVPEPVASAADAMRGFPSYWALCGGWAVDAWLGEQTRPHPDVDISVFHDRQRDLVEHFAGWVLHGHDTPDDDNEDQWAGATLGHPAHVHARSTDGMNLDIQLDRRDGDRWMVSPDLSLPLDECVRTGGWGVPTVVPAVLLYFKGSDQIRPHDEADFRLLAPRLDPDARSWLADALRSHRPDHPWLASL